MMRIMIFVVALALPAFCGNDAVDMAVEKAIKSCLGEHAPSKIYVYVGLANAKSVAVARLQTEAMLKWARTLPEGEAKREYLYELTDRIWNISEAESELRTHAFAAQMKKYEADKAAAGSTTIPLPPCLGKGK